MSEPLAQETIDKIIDLLAAGEEEAAVLLCLRTQGCTPDEAWGRVRQILIDLGDEDKAARPQPTLGNVKEYLADSPWERLRPTLQAALVAILFFLASGYLFIGHIPPLVVELRSFAWSETEATILKARAYSKKRPVQTRQVDIDYMDFTFRYEVEGREYTDRKTRVKYYDLFGDEPFQAGDRFMVIYNPKNPGQNVYQRLIYQRVVRLLFGIALFVFAALASWYVASRARMFRRLKEFDTEILGD